jgi:hypothetical protein
MSGSNGRSYEVKLEWNSKEEQGLDLCLNELESTDFDWDKISGVHSTGLTQSHHNKSNKIQKKIFTLKDIEKMNESSSMSLNYQSSFISIYEVIAYENSFPPLVQFPEGMDLERLCKYSYMKRYYVKEIKELNELIHQIGRELLIIRGILDKSFYSEPFYERIIQSIRSNQVPEQWKRYSKVRTMTFSVWMKHLNDKRKYWAGISENIATSIMKFDLRMISDPKGLIDSFLLDNTYRRAPTVNFSEIVMSVKVLGPQERLKSNLQDVRRLNFRRAWC